MTWEKHNKIVEKFAYWVLLPRHIAEQMEDEGSFTRGETPYLVIINTRIK